MFKKQPKKIVFTVLEGLGELDDAVAAVSSELDNIFSLRRSTDSF